MSQILDLAHGTPDGVRYRVNPLFPGVPGSAQRSWTPGGGDSTIGAPGNDELEIDRFDT